MRKDLWRTILAAGIVWWLAPAETCRAQGFGSMEYLRNRVYDRAVTGVGHPEILAYYENHPEEFKVDDNVVWQDLFINASRHPSREAARKLAEVLLERARKGEDFVRLAKEYDNGVSSLSPRAEGATP